MLETAPKAKLVDLIVRVAASRPAVRHECLNYLNKHAALSHKQKNQSEGEKLLALWAELAPDLDELDAYGGGDYGADFHLKTGIQRRFSNTIYRVSATSRPTPRARNTSARHR